MGFGTLQKFRILLLLAAGSAGVFSPAAQGLEIPPCQGIPADAQVITQLKNHNKSAQVYVRAQVERILPNDNNGLHHEKFVVAVGNVPVYVAHDTSIAPAVPLHPGDIVLICGEFLAVGPSHALIHWTHHDPNGQHAAGFIVDNNQIYQ